MPLPVPHSMKLTFLVCFTLIALSHFLMAKTASLLLLVRRRHIASEVALA